MYLRDLDRCSQLLRGRLAAECETKGPRDLGLDIGAGFPFHAIRELFALLPDEAAVEQSQGLDGGGRASPDGGGLAGVGAVEWAEDTVAGQVGKLRTLRK